MIHILLKESVNHMFHRYVKRILFFIQSGQAFVMLIGETTVFKDIRFEGFIFSKPVLFIFLPSLFTLQPGLIYPFVLNHNPLGLDLRRGNHHPKVL